MMLSEIFANFEIEDTGSSKERGQACPDQYVAEDHSKGWFLRSDTLRITNAEVERELLYHSAVYFYHHEEFKLAVEEFKALHSDHKHSRTHSVAVIDSVIRCALKIPSYAVDDLLAFLSDYERCALDYGDQLQYLSLKKDVYACIPGQRAEIIFVDTVCLLCSSVDLPEHWLAFGQRKDLKVGANFRLGYTIRAYMLLERHLKHAHGFVVDVLRKKLSALNRTLEEMKCSPDQIREAQKMMSSDLRHLEDENDQGDQLRRPAHECRSKVEVYKTEDECFKLVERFKLRFSWMFEESPYVHPSCSSV